MPDPSALRVIDGKEQHAGDDDRGKNYEPLGEGHFRLCAGLRADHTAKAYSDLCCPTIGGRDLKG